VVSFAMKNRKYALSNFGLTTGDLPRAEAILGGELPWPSLETSQFQVPHTCVIEKTGIDERPWDRFAEV
jgi:hypothetical protein